LKLGRGKRLAAYRERLLLARVVVGGALVLKYTFQEPGGRDQDKYARMNVWLVAWRRRAAARMSAAGVISFGQRWFSAGA